MTDSPTPTSADARESNADFVERLARLMLSQPSWQIEIDRQDLDRLIAIGRHAVAPASPDPTAGAPSLMSAEELDGFDARARAATPGSWQRLHDGTHKRKASLGGFDQKVQQQCDCGQVWSEAVDWPVAYCDTREFGEGPTSETRMANAAHIAGLDPQTVLRLVAQARLALGQADGEASAAAFWAEEAHDVERAMDAHDVPTDSSVGPYNLVGRVMRYGEMCARTAPPRASDAYVTDDMAGAALEAFHEIEGRRDVSEIESMRTAVRAALAAMPDRDPAGRVRGLTEAAGIARERGNFWLLDGDKEASGSPEWRYKRGMRAGAYDAEEAIRAAASSVPREDGREDGWIVSNGNGTLFRTWGDVGPEWTTQAVNAVRYARRQDAERTHAQDEDAWHIVRWPLAPQELRR